MTPHEHFSKAPITEALIDLRVTLSAGIDVTVFEKLATALEEDYPKRTNLAHGQMNVAFGEQPKVETFHRITGIKLVSAEDRYIIQARLEGFTFSILAPYDRWETFCDKARRAWAIYCETLKPVEVTRVAVRYINRIDIPVDDLSKSIHIEDYLHTYPEIANGVPQNMAGYFMQIMIPIVEMESVLIVNQTIVPPPQPNTVSIVLDLDLYRQDNVPQQEEGLWKLFEELRVKKNEIFLACIADKTKELIR